MEEKNEVAKKPETIREWYHRTTNKWIRGLVGASAISLVAAGFLFALAGVPFLAKLQTFNGAFVIPIAGLLWLLSFVFIFLIPSREVGFRSMEAMDRMEERLLDLFEKKILPATKVWERVGLAVEKEINGGLIKELREAIKELRATSGKIEKAASDGEKFSEEAKPAIAALKRIEERVEREIASGLFEDARIAITGLKEMSVPVGATEPDTSNVLANLRKKKAADAAAKAGVPS